jgi:uncharacterized membrane protein
MTTRHGKRNTEDPALAAHRKGLTMNLQLPPLERTTRAGWTLIGFALGGFLDGIVLHQILQWHHLLSGLGGPAGAELRFQVMADGLFHLLMYVLLLAGLALLAISRASYFRPVNASEIARYSLIGFGSWHVVDAVASHWLLGLHHVRMDSSSPVAWDIGWLVMFGIVPLVAAAVLPSRGGRARGASAVMITITLFSGGIATVGPRFDGASETIVVFRDGASPAAMIGAVAAADSTLKWSDRGGTLWVIDKVSWSGMAALYRHGALVVSTTPAFGGCLAASRIAKS